MWFFFFFVWTDRSVQQAIDLGTITEIWFAPNSPTKIVPRSSCSMPRGLVRSSIAPVERVDLRRVASATILVPAALSRMRWTDGETE